VGWPAVLRASTLLGATAAALVLFVQGTFGPTAIERAAATWNNYPWDLRLKVGAAMATAFVLAAAFGFVVRARSGEARLRWLAHRLAPLAVLGFLPPLGRPGAWSDALVTAVAVAALTLLTERLLRLSFDADAELALASPPPRPFLGARASAWGAARVRRVREVLARIGARVPGRRWGGGVARMVRAWGPAAFVVAMAAGYAVYMSVFTLRMHGRFGTFGYDLGQVDNMFWSTLHGHPLRDSPLDLRDDWSELRNHAELATFVLLPVYALKPGAAVLLVLQSCALGLGAIPLYRFAARRLPRSYACAMAVAYLLFPPMHGMQFYDVHFQPIAVPFVLFVIDFVDEGRYWAAAIPFVVALACREDVSIGLTILGVFLVLAGHRGRAGWAITILAGAYFVGMNLVVMPRMGKSNFGAWTASYIYKDLIPAGAQNITGVVATLLTNPDYVFRTLVTADKLRYALQVLAPVAFLPLRRAPLAVSLVHGSILTVLTTHYAPTIEIGFQYSANFIPYMFPAVVLALQAMGDAPAGLARRRAAMGAVLAGTALCGLFWGAVPPRKEFHGGFDTLPMTAPTDADRKKDADLRELHALVPQDAWLAMSEHEMPHISRLNMLSLRDTTDADYLLYQVGSGYFGSDRADQALKAGTFKIVAERPGLVLAQRIVPLPPKSP
jgi:uncharacterized membrane protein